MSAIIKCASWLVLCAVCFDASAIDIQRISDEVTSDNAAFDALISRTAFRALRISPDGRRVAYLAMRGMARSDVYEFTIGVIDTDAPGRESVVARYRLAASEALQLSAGYFATLPRAGQFRWSDDSTMLLFTTHQGGGMQLRRWDVAHEASTLVLGGHDEIRIIAASAEGEARIETLDAVETSQTMEPIDRALRIRDGYRLSGPLANPKTDQPIARRTWAVRWDDTPPRELSRDEPAYLGFPDEPNQDARERVEDRLLYDRRERRSPDGAHVVKLEYGSTGHQSPTSGRYFITLKLSATDAPTRTLATASTDRDVIWLSMLGWDEGGQEFFFFERRRDASAVRALTSSGAVRTVYQEAAANLDPLEERDEEFVPSFSAGSRKAAFVRSGSLQREDLVVLDLRSGRLSTLYQPNRALDQSGRMQVRYFDLEDDVFFGRLYLPKAAPSEPLPLVIATYRSRPGGLESIPGDEIPIPVLVAHGIAVFLLDVGLALDSNERGDFNWELNRVERPRRALEGLIDRWAQEGLIDPGRVGLAGVSYGMELAMYAYWKSRAFCAISTTGGAWSPAAIMYTGLGWTSFMERRGFAEGGQGSRAQWRQLSAAYNARADLPPLLWQSPESERYFFVESWFKLRRAKAPVEWWDYPGEGHLKRGPAAKWWTYRRNTDWFRFWLQDFVDSDPRKSEQYERWRAMRPVLRAKDSSLPGE